MPDSSGRDLLSESRRLMDSLVNAAASAAGRPQLPQDVAKLTQRQIELLQEVIERERRLQGELAALVTAPVDALFDLLEETGATLRLQAEALESAGHALEETAGLMKRQAERFERTVGALRQPAELAKAAAGARRTPSAKAPSRAKAASKPKAPASGKAPAKKPPSRRPRAG